MTEHQQAFNDLYEQLRRAGASAIVASEQMQRMVQTTDEETRAARVAYGDAPNLDIDDEPMDPSCLCNGARWQTCPVHKREPVIAATVRIVVKGDDPQVARKLLDLWLASYVHRPFEIISDEDNIADTLDMQAAYVQSVEREV